MTQLRIRDAAAFLGVSDDTVRRLVDGGTFDRATDDAGRAVVDGRQVAEYARARSTELAAPDTGVKSSARNRFVGIVTDLVVDTVMAQVELQCGPHRVVSLMSAEAVRDLGLEVGSVAVASVKATMVTVEAPTHQEDPR
ncbi:TOBE domain-containing protein [Curtobacterium sp. VKM Ac-2861]|uniref:TOBE domain-containing protein n=1 Tax=Bacteria TaxID=2 RepID=UPI000DA9EEA7|nr:MULTISPECIES: TOBE domain-containing protein [unclassified Curtobacterium]NQW91880.1 TOBE domain-containing protein [Curtobacterium sp. VKM Ac-2861]QSB23109.1 TOBE domain-containing protein [Curtobacterium sp. 24E2]TCU48273.1 molybdopterin-binding protein [Curtobacterium sp. PhB146]TCU83935.1 molybdopterin-binding protein [Curtobacterium sp. PhB191]WIE71435.1 TOBE domain-containing protein [Curtobacterium sp. MCJR17_020]